MTAALEPRRIRAEMVRRGLGPMHARTPYVDQNGERVDPMDDDDLQVSLDQFVHWLWDYCLDAEV